MRTLSVSEVLKEKETDEEINMANLVVEKVNSDEQAVWIHVFDQSGTLTALSVPRRGIELFEQAKLIKSGQRISITGSVATSGSGNRSRFLRLQSVNFLSQ